jgi:hypothetical protein
LRARSVRRSSPAICHKARRLVTHRVFQPSPEQPLNFEATIERTLLDLRQRFFLCKVLYDPYQMQATAQRLTRAGVKLEEFPQSPANLTTISQNLFELIRGQNLLAYPDPDTSGLRSVARWQARRHTAGGSPNKHNHIRSTSWSRWPWRRMLLSRANRKAITTNALRLLFPSRRNDRRPVVA